MFNKSMIALTAAVIVGSASAAFSYDDPESRIGDKYPFLEQQPSRTIAVRNIGGPYLPVRSTVSLNQPLPEDVEAQIADKYPTLEPAAPPASAASILRTRVAMRQAETSLLTIYEDPESRVADKYPLLERISPVGSRAVNTARLRHPKNKV